MKDPILSPNSPRVIPVIFMSYLAQRRWDMANLAIAGNTEGLWTLERLRRLGWTPMQERLAGIDRRLQADPQYAGQLADWLEAWENKPESRFFDALFGWETGVLSFNGFSALDQARAPFVERRHLASSLPAVNTDEASLPAGPKTGRGLRL
jgi:hypothetical protein